MSKHIEKKQFVDLYFSMKNKDLAKKLNISQTTLVTYARKLGIRKRKGCSHGTIPKIIFTE